jgi:multidrug transporter EmrE-like cation transporter
MWQILLFFVILIELMADVLAKEWSLHDRWFFSFGAIACYIACNVIWLYSLRYGAGLTRGASIFSIATMSTATLVGILVFKEPFTLRILLGIVLGGIAIALIGQ